MRLSSNEVKKGDVIIEVQAWNFIQGWIRRPRRDCSHIETDVYRTTKWTVFSCGKKQMKLVDDQGMANKIIYIEDGIFTGTNIIGTYEDALLCVEELFLSDKNSTNSYKIEEHRY